MNAQTNTIINAGLSGVNRSALVHTVREDGAIGVATMVALAAMHGFNTPHTLPTLEQYTETLASVRNMIVAKEGDWANTAEEGQFRMMLNGTRKLSGATLADLLIDSELAFREAGVKVQLPKDDDSEELSQVLRFWYPEWTDEDRMSAVRKIVNSRINMR